MKRPRPVIHARTEETRAVNEQWATAVTDLLVGRRGPQLRVSRVVDDPTDVLFEIADAGAAFAFSGSTANGVAFEVKGSPVAALRSLGSAILALADHLDQGSQRRAES